MDQPLPVCILKSGEVYFTNIRVSIKFFVSVLKMKIGLLSWDHQRQVEYLIPELCYQYFRWLFDVPYIGIHLCMTLECKTYIIVDIFLYSGA